MPLLTCKECGELEAGYWHCEYNRQHRYDTIKLVCKQLAIYAFVFVVAWLLVRYL